MHDLLYPHNRLFAAAGVVTGPFAETPFHLGLFFRRWDLAFENDFRGCGHRHSGERRATDFHRRAAQSAGIVVFTGTGFGSRWRRHPGRPLAAKDDGDRASARRLPILASDPLAVFVIDDP